MKKSELIKQVRMYIVGILGCISFILMVSEPIEEETWLQVFLYHKVYSILNWIYMLYPFYVLEIQGFIT